MNESTAAVDPEEKTKHLIVKINQCFFREGLGPNTWVDKTEASRLYTRAVIAATCGLDFTEDWAVFCVVMGVSTTSSPILDDTYSPFGKG